MVRYKKESGAILILALLIMSVVITVSLGASLLVISETKQSRQLDQSVMAYYAAESGVERALYQVRKQDFDREEFNQMNEQLSNNSSYRLVAKDTENVVYATIAMNESYQLDLYNPHSLDQLEDSIKSLAISWDHEAWLEINWICWSTSGELGETQSLYYSPAESMAIVPLYQTGCSLYRVRMIPRKFDNPSFDSTNIEITAYSLLDPTICEDGPGSGGGGIPGGGGGIPGGGGDPPGGAGLPIIPGHGGVPGGGEDPPFAVICRSSLPARIQIKGLGKFPANTDEASRQAILVSMPRRSPAARFFDYVIFSESDVEKF
ncbi:pilus assembly PilX N-terminal domain-containing protein [Patescibacteria group bacterium]|nr:pilus assembly PilX N-terminal domain-containing protein [Patescibacteria group bacterium]